MSKYTVRQVGHDIFRFVKWDQFLFYETEYAVYRSARGHWLCNCFQQNAHTCKHRRMVHLFIDLRRVNGWFYDPETQTWDLPIPQQEKLRRMLSKEREHEQQGRAVVSGIAFGTQWRVVTDTG